MKLKPCPNVKCGGEGNLCEIGTNDGSVFFYVRCLKCGYISGMFRIKEKATNDWNERPVCEWTQDEEGFVATCEKMLHITDVHDIKYCPYCGREIKIIIKV